MVQEEFVSFKAQAVKWFDKLKDNVPQVIEAGLRAGAGAYAEGIRARLMRMLPQSNHVTAQGAFKGQRMTDSIWVKARPRDLSVSVFLNRGRDARLDWFENGTDERFGMRRRKIARLQRLGHNPGAPSRGWITELRFMTSSITSTVNKANEAFDKAVNAAIEKIN